MLSQTGYIFLFNNLRNDFRKLDTAMSVDCVGFGMLGFGLRRSADRDRVTWHGNRFVCIRAHIHAMRLLGFWPLVCLTIGISVRYSSVDGATYIADFGSWFKRGFHSL